MEILEGREISRAQVVKPTARIKEKKAVVLVIYLYVGHYFVIFRSLKNRVFGALLKTSFVFILFI